MTQFKFFAIFFMLIASTMNAQKSVVTVEVYDEFNTPSAYALVELYDATDQLVDGAVTDDMGKAVLKEIPFGDYDLKIEQTAFETIQSSIQINSKKQNLGKFTLKVKTELDEVVVRAETSKFKAEIDKRVIEVGKDLVSSGANASDVLNNVPSVSVDQQTGELSLRGNSNVRVLVDGKPSNVPTAILLKQLPSNSIKTIEIITNPSAKYDPEGNSGILNIITNKEKRKGYNVGLTSGFTRGRRSRANASINTNYNTGKFNLFGNYAGNWGKNYFFGNLENQSTDIDQFFGIEDNEPGNLVKVGFDFFIDDKTALTLYTNQNFSKGKGNWNYEFYENNDTFKNENDEHSDYHNQDYSMNFKRSFDRDDHYIEIDGIFSTSTQGIDRGFLVNYPESDLNPISYDENRDRDNNNLRINFDYHNVFKEKTTLEAGTQYRREGIQNNFDSNQIYYNPDNNSQSYQPYINYDFTRSIYSTYFNLKRKFGKWGTQVGLRFENVQEKSEDQYNDFTNEALQSDFNKNYNALYPSAFLTYSLGEKNTLSLNYSRRVDRPSVYQLSPVPQWNAGLIRNIGNPDLKPQYTNSLELGFLRTLKGGSLSANLFYRRIEDMISRVLTADPEVANGTLLEFGNYNHSDSYGVETSLYTKIKDWWTLNASLDFFSNEIQFLNTTRRATPFNARVSQDFTVWKKLKLQYFFMYRGKTIFAQGEMRPMWRMDMGARYDFAKGKASITTRMSDIFNTFYAQADVEQPYLAKGIFRWEAKTFYIGLNYNLGGKVKTRADKQQNRGNSGGGGGVGF